VEDAMRYAVSHEFDRAPIDLMEDLFRNPPLGVVVQLPIDASDLANDRCPGGEIVGDDHDRDGPSEIVESGDEYVAVAGIHGRQGLVEEENLGFSGECPSDEYPLHLTSRQVSDRSKPNFGQAKAFEESIDHCDIAGTAPTLESLEAEAPHPHDILDSQRKVGVEVCELRDVPHRSGTTAGVTFDRSLPRLAEP
jgi:hypothetical protein